MKRLLANSVAILSAVALGFGGWLFFVYTDIFLFGHKSGSRGMLSIVLGMIFSALLIASEIIFLRKKKLNPVAHFITIIYSVVFVYFVSLIWGFGGFHILFNIESKPHHSISDEEMIPLTEYYSSNYLENISKEN
jgi:hypothetical protein